MEQLAQSMTAIGFMVLPASVIYTSRRMELFARVSPVIWCYLLGILIGNSGLLPPSAVPVQDTLAELTVALSIPLMLFSADLGNWRIMGRTAGLSIVLAGFSVTVVVAVGHFLFRSLMPYTPELAGLLVGVYTGGTPNLAAIRTALEVDSSVYITVHTADLLVSALYILFIITIAKPVFARVLRPFQAQVGAPADVPGSEGVASAFSRAGLPKTLKAFALAAMLVAASVGLAELLPPGWTSVAVILLLTTGAIAASFHPRVRRLETSFSLGEYVVLVFCAVVGSMADVGRIMSASPTILLFVSFTVLLSLLLHLALARIFRIDVDTMIVTSTAAICSPPFVGMVAVSIGNKAIIAAGITAGILGYAIGNYLGVFTGLLLRSISL
ncbi:MAG: DUF819 family protein [Spirochaetota bacterium]